MTSNSQVGSYTYPASGPTSVRPHAVTQAGPNSYAYDANGNLTTGAGRTITYDIENRPIQIVSGGVTTTFVYDGDGGRVKKTAGGITTVYIGKLYECTGSACSKYIFAGGQRVALKPVGAGEVYYYQPDHLGSSNVVTNQAGAKLQELTYYPYGQTRTNTGTINVNHKYTSQELDGSTGLYFYNARYYDPVLGRFISADTIIPNPRDPQDFNRYSYVNNNPLNYVDPTGHWKFRNFAKSYAIFEIQRSMIAGSVAAAVTGNEWAIPVINAAGTMAIAQIEGANTRDTLRAGAISAATSVAASYAGGYVGSAVETATGSGTAGIIAGGAAGGYVGAAATTLALGGSTQQAMQAGLRGAVIGAATAYAMAQVNTACDGCLSPNRSGYASQVSDDNTGGMRCAPITSKCGGLVTSVEDRPGGPVLKITNKGEELTVVITPGQYRDSSTYHRGPIYFSADMSVGAETRVIGVGKSVIIPYGKYPDYFGYFQINPPQASRGTNPDWWIDQAGWRDNSSPN